MAKTRDQVITRALRKLGVVAEDEDASTAMLANASEALDSVLGEVGAAAIGASAWTTSRGGATPDLFPDEVANSLSDLLAVELAPEYPPSQAPYPRSVAWQRLMALVRPDNRFILPYTGMLFIAETFSGVYGYERDEAGGALWPVLPGVRRIVAETATDVLRVVPDGRNKLGNDLDRLDIRFQDYFVGLSQPSERILTWDSDWRDYRRTDADLVAFVAAETAQQITISDPDQTEEAAARAAFY